MSLECTSKEPIYCHQSLFFLPQCRHNIVSASPLINDVRMFVILLGSVLGREASVSAPMSVVAALFARLLMITSVSAWPGSWFSSLQ